MLCVQLCHDLLALVPTDSHVLSTLGLVLKAAGRVSELGAAYEAACAKEPKNEELVRGHFNSCVRYTYGHTNVACGQYLPGLY